MSGILTRLATHETSLILPKGCLTPFLAGEGENGAATRIFGGFSLPWGLSLLLSDGSASVVSGLGLNFHLSKTARQRCFCLREMRPIL
jgi:hypothetical protein